MAPLAITEAPEEAAEPSARYTGELAKLSVQVVDLRNGGVLAGLTADDVVEVPARIGREGPMPVAQAPLAPELLGLVQHVAAYERLAVRAALSGERSDARRALLTHPLIGQWGRVEALLERMAAVGARS